MRDPDDRLRVEEFAQREGWPRVARDTAADDDFRDVSWYPADGGSVVLTEFLGIGESAVAVNSDDASRAVDLLNRLEEAVDTYRLDELLAAVGADDPGDRADAILRLGLGAPRDPDPRFVTAIISAMADPDPVVRDAAVWASSYVPFAAYRNPLRGLRDDEDEDVREAATVLLESFDETGVPES